MSNLEMFYFAGKCLSIDEHPEFSEEIIHKISSDQIDWPQFVHLCSNHLILPVIYLKFKSHDVLPYLPGELADFLKEIYDLNLVRNEQILLQINDILEILNNNDIYPTFLKGTGNLLDGLYSDKGERMIGDIDFLVPEKDYLKAAKLLENQGYFKELLNFTDIRYAKHYPRLFKSGVPADVEVHRLIVQTNFGRKFNHKTIDKRKVEMSNENICYVLTDQHNVILNFIHSQLAHKGNLNGIVSFRDVYDLYLISKRIDILSILNDIPYKGKAVTYFVFAGKALGLQQRFCRQESFSSRLFERKHSLNHTSPAFYKTYRGCVFFSDRIFRGYIGRILRCFYSKSERQIVIDCLCSRQWYKVHFNSYLEIFKMAK